MHLSNVDAAKTSQTKHFSIPSQVQAFSVRAACVLKHQEQDLTLTAHPLHARTRTEFQPFQKLLLSTQKNSFSCSKTDERKERVQRPLKKMSKDTGALLEPEKNPAKSTDFCLCCGESQGKYLKNFSHTYEYHPSQQDIVDPPPPKRKSLRLLSPRRSISKSLSSKHCFHGNSLFRCIFTPAPCQQFCLSSGQQRIGKVRKNRSSLEKGNTPASLKIRNIPG